MVGVRGSSARASRSNQSSSPAPLCAEALRAPSVAFMIFDDTSASLIVRSIVGDPSLRAGTTGVLIERAASGLVRTENGVVSISDLKARTEQRVLINNGIVLSLLVLHLYAQSRNIHMCGVNDFSCQQGELLLQNSDMACLINELDLHIAGFVHRHGRFMLIKIFPFHVRNAGFGA